MEPFRSRDGGSAATVASALALWLEDRLREERLLLEGRHFALAEALRLELCELREPEADAAIKDVLIVLTDSEPVSRVSDCRDLRDADRRAAGVWRAASPARGDRMGALVESMSKEDIAEGDPRCEEVAERSWTPDDSMMTQKPRKEGQARRHGSLIISSEMSDHPMNRLERVVSSARFEMASSAMILANAFCMALEVQFHSTDTAISVQYVADGSAWAGGDDFFALSENVFGALFTAEALIKIVSYKWRFFCNGWNVLDLIIVLIWLMDGGFGLTLALNPMMLRLCRLLRLVRLVRLVRMIEMFDTLVLMITSIQASGPVLLWGTVLLVTIMTVCALCLNALLVAYMRDESKPDDMRLDVFLYFGSFTRSIITMFEITLGNWVPCCRLLHDNVSEMYGLFFVIYKCVVGFAVVKVITGVFLHETFKCASMDDELMIQANERASNKFNEKMSDFFEELDSSGNGMVDFQEFMKIIDEPRVTTWLAAMELSVRNPESLFAFLCDGDDQLTCNEMVKGINRLRGQASAVDVVALLEESSALKQIVRDGTADIKQLLQALSPGGPRQRVANVQSRDGDTSI